MLFSPKFNRHHKDKRVKFIEVGNKLLVYDAKESLLTETNNLPFKYHSEIIKAPIPPVKTLILHTTYKCNYKCRHCYLKAGRGKPDEMNIEELSRIVKEFGEMGGLGIDLSGGEALLKEGIEDIIKDARDQRLRTIILSNAGNLNKAQLRRISPHIDGIAVGLDGLYKTNDIIRGDGTFKKTKRGLEMISEEGIELSITTLITPESIPQLLYFPKFIGKYGAKSWSLVMPRPSGRFVNEQNKIDKTYTIWEKAKRENLLKQLQTESKKEEISVILDHILVPDSKKRIEETSKDFVYEMYNKGRTCWDNTITIMPNGDVKCCLFFDGQIYDNIKKKSLREVYESKQRKKALVEFKKYPVDKCPFLGKENLKKFEHEIEYEI